MSLLMENYRHPNVKHSDFQHRKQYICHDEDEIHGWSRSTELEDEGHRQSNHQQQTQRILSPDFVMSV